MSLFSYERKGEGNSSECNRAEFIRVETDIKITDTGFGVDELKVKDWNKEID